MIYIKVVSEPASRILGEYKKEKVHGETQGKLQYLPCYFLPEDLFELLAHEAVDDEVGGAVDDEEPVHEARQAEEPGGRHVVVSALAGCSFCTKTAPHHHCHCSPEGSVDDELRHVDDESGEVAEEEHDDDADEDRGQVHLVVGGAVPVGPHVGVPAQGGHIKYSLFLLSTYLIPLNIAVLK